VNFLPLVVDAVEAAIKVATTAISAASQADAEIVARLQSVLVSALVHVDAALVALDEARKTADAEINAAGPK